MLDPNAFGEHFLLPSVSMSDIIHLGRTFSHRRHTSSSAKPPLRWASVPGTHQIEFDAFPPSRRNHRHARAKGESPKGNQLAHKKKIYIYKLKKEKATGNCDGGCSSFLSLFNPIRSSRSGTTTHHHLARIRAPILRLMLLGTKRTKHPARSTSQTSPAGRCLPGPLHAATNSVAYSVSLLFCAGQNRVLD